jgi:hypothetical protein
MSSEDAETAFLRHATSKLMDERALKLSRRWDFGRSACRNFSRFADFSSDQAEKQGGGTSLTLEAGRVIERFPAAAPKEQRWS